MKYMEFENKVVAEYNKRFPESLCYVRIYNCMGIKSIDINLYLSKNGSEVAHGLIENDMFHFNFEIRLSDNFDVNNEELPEEMTLDRCGSFYWIMPEDAYLYYGKRKIAFRKVIGDPEKIIMATGKIFDKILAAVKKDVHDGKIHINYRDIVSKKVHL